MYPEITPLIRAAIKRRYELIPYNYSSMLESHMTALPPQRWIGHGYESDSEVWTPKVMAGETQYWLGDSLMVGGCYEPGETSARMYLPTKENSDGFINLNAPYQHLKAGEWVDIKSEWKDSIPLLARIGGAIVVGKDVQTRAPGDHTHPSPNVFEDDYRAVEIFPPAGDSTRTYSNTWYEDDGIAAKPDISSFTITYSSTSSQVVVDVQKSPENKYTPVWKDLHIILPVEDRRTVLWKGEMLAQAAESRGRIVYKLELA